MSYATTNQLVARDATGSAGAKGSRAGPLSSSRGGVDPMARLLHTLDRKDSCDIPNIAFS